MSAKNQLRGSVMQMEFDRARVGTMEYKFGFDKYSTGNALWHVANGCLVDVMKNGGTLVIVVSAEKMTLVQRPDAEPLE